MSSFNLGTSKFANRDRTRDCLLAQFFGLDLSTLFFGKIVELVAARRETFMQFMLKGNPTGACMCACCQCRAGKHSQHTTNLDNNSHIPCSVE